MNLKPFSEEEFLLVRTQLVGRCSISRVVSEAVIKLLEKSYNTYKKEFKYTVWEPLTFKPISYEKFVQRLLGNSGRVMRVRNPRIVANTGQEFDAIWKSGSSRSTFTEKHDQDLLDLADYCTDKILFETEDLRFCDIIAKYSTEPHTFTYDEIVRIEKLAHQYEYATEEYNRIIGVQNAVEAANS